jgi:hypothetical protein
MKMTDEQVKAVAKRMLAADGVVGREAEHRQPGLYEAWAGDTAAALAAEGYAVLSPAEVEAFSEVVAAVWPTVQERYHAAYDVLSAAGLLPPREAPPSFDEDSARVRAGDAL